MRLMNYLKSAVGQRQKLKMKLNKIFVWIQVSTYFRRRTQDKAAVTALKYQIQQNTLFMPCNGSIREQGMSAIDSDEQNLRT